MEVGYGVIDGRFSCDHVPIRSEASRYNRYKPMQMYVDSVGTRFALFRYSAFNWIIRL